MHTRHNRNPGNRYRAVGSRNSSEGPTRGPGFFNSESRSFNRGFSCNQSQNHRRNFHRPPPVPPIPPRADVFMEVGRLAAEYLVSKGVLPRDALPAKWQNGSLKKLLSEFQEFRPHEEENMQFPGAARTSALARLGNTGFGGESGRRKYNDDYGTVGPRNHVKGKRKGGSSGNYGWDWDREYVRTGSWSDRHRDGTSPSTDLDRDCSSRHHEEHPARKDDGKRMAGDYYSSSRLPEEQFVKDDNRMDVDKDTGSRLHEEPVFGKGDRDMSELTGTSATPLKGVDNEDSESEIKGQQIEELSEMKDPDVVKDTPDVTNEEIKTDSLDLGSSQQMTDNTLRIPGEEAEVDLRNKGEINGEINDPSKDKTTVKEIISGDPTPENFTTYASLSEKSGTYLKALCKFTNVPTRIRSSLAKGAKKGSIVSVDGIDQIGPSESLLNDNNLSVSTDNGSSGGCDEPKVLLTPQVVEGEKGFLSDDAIGPAQELESENSLGDGKPDSASPQDQANSAGPESLGDGMLENDRSLNRELHGSGSGDPVVEKKGEKRLHGGIDMDGQYAWRKEWLYQSTKDCLSPSSRNAGERSNLTNPVSSSKVDTIGDSLSSGENATTVSHSCPVNNFQVPELMHKPNFVDIEEKQFFPSSFKICDLNLMESSDAHENQDRDAIFPYPSVAAVKKSASPIDTNLSICYSVTSVENSKRVAGCEEVEIIDLEGNSAPEHKTFSITERRTETAFMGLEEFSTPVPNTADVRDSQDGYGLMNSGLLANDFPGVITPDPGDINPLDYVGLHNGEAARIKLTTRHPTHLRVPGTNFISVFCDTNLCRSFTYSITNVPLSDDDLIYMSFGEIPFLSFFAELAPFP